MDFARKILNKYGWKEGEGLGKNNNGIVKPLKASMKFDNAGLGSDQAASDFNNHWWERVFNEAAENVDVKTTKNGVSVDLKNKDESVEISTKEYSVKKLKKAKNQSGKGDKQYDNFLQSATLTKSGDEIENPNKIAVADISVKKYKSLTDEELFHACGGRTAHKGARHGLKLSGKLARIEQQEQELLAKMEEEKKKSEKNTINQCLDKKLDVNDNADNQQKKSKNKRYAGCSEQTDFNVSMENNTINKVKKNKRKDPDRKAKKNELITANIAQEEPVNVSKTTILYSADTTTHIKQNKRKDSHEREPKKNKLITADLDSETIVDENEVTINTDSFDNKNLTLENNKNKNSAKKNKRKRKAADHNGEELSDKTNESISDVTANNIKRKKNKHSKK